MGDMKVCVIPKCGRPALTLRRTLCLTHYNRLTNGRNLIAPVRAVRPRRLECVVEGCNNLDKGPHGYCPKHLGRVKNNGSPHITKHQRDRPGRKLEEHPRWTGDNPSYNAAHLRVRAALGSASFQRCIDCDGQAKQWSYTHTDPNELASDLGPYSASAAFYVPRCVSCHKRFDLARKAT